MFKAKVFEILAGAFAGLFIGASGTECLYFSQVQFAVPHHPWLVNSGWGIFALLFLGMFSLLVKFRYHVAVCVVSLAGLGLFLLLVKMWS
jgi:hypothetical protein